MLKNVQSAKMNELLTPIITIIDKFLIDYTSLLLQNVNHNVFSPSHKEFEEKLEKKKKGAN
mgnify:CR=1 FL=1